MGTLLGGRERRLFDSVAMEVMRLMGADNPILWKFVANPKISKNINPALAVDCLYEEPVPFATDVDAVKVKHYQKYCVMVHFEEPDTSVDVDDNGLSERSESTAWFVRQNLEDVKVPVDDAGDHLVPGDILQLFSRGNSLFFDIINTVRVGFQNDSSNYTHYKADLVRNRSYVPERKIFP